MIPQPILDHLFALLQEEASKREQLFHHMALVSHELKTPLTAIKGSLQLAGRQLHQPGAAGEATTGRIDALLALALRQVEHLTLLVGDLSDLSQQRPGSLALQARPCDLRDIVTQAVEVVAWLAPQRPIHLALPGEPVTAQVDARRIEQVIVNLLSNALKYSADHLPIRVALDERGDEVALCVRDEGPGLSHEAQGRIWEAFYRAPESTAQVGPRPGLGLGLCICQMIIVGHRGQIGVTSAPGAGATFWFTLSHRALSALAEREDREVVIPAHATALTPR